MESVSVKRNKKVKRTAQKKIDKVCLVNALLLLGLRLEQRKCTIVKDEKLIFKQSFAGVLFQYCVGDICFKSTNAAS